MTKAHTTGTNCGCFGPQTVKSGGANEVAVTSDLEYEYDALRRIARRLIRLSELIVLSIPGTKGSRESFGEVTSGSIPKSLLGKS